MIILGYYISSKLFSGAFTSITELFVAMVFILGSVIIGTYLFYKGSVSFIFNLIRKRKNGHLTIHHVLSLSSIMFRMKSNALLLTIITTVSALAIGFIVIKLYLLLFSRKVAENNVAADFALANILEATQFEKALRLQHIEYNEQKISIIKVDANLTQIMGKNLKELNFNPRKTTLSLVSDRQISRINVRSGDTIFAGANDLLQKFMPLKEAGNIKLMTKKQSITLNYLGLKKESIVSTPFTSGGLP